MSAVITVEGLAKRYLLAHGGRDPYLSFREVIADKARGLLRRGRVEDQQPEEFWALRDVSFEIAAGARVGIIGRNGAGKSTLLKILSRIVEPTAGRAILEGRVASLLEVGTGFHPELTGRENIFLNGAILGMSAADIRRRFDEIVAFAEVERFLDTPVKRYSSGMYVRLAFAVAAHLEPEILIVDEVLSVGDAQFQKKCLGKMGEEARAGRTILFVSHNLPTVVSLCDHVIWLDAGRVRQTGQPQRIISEYLSHRGGTSEDGRIPEGAHEHPPGALRFQRIVLSDQAGRLRGRIPLASPIRLTCEFEVRGERAIHPRIGVVFTRSDGDELAVVYNTDAEMGQAEPLGPGRYGAEVRVELPLMPGTYHVHLFAKEMPGYWSSPHASLDWVQHALAFEVDAASAEGFSPLPSGMPLHPGSSWAMRRLVEGAQGTHG